MGNLNFVKNRWKKYLLKLWIIDFAFMAVVAALIMYSVSVVISVNNSGNIRLKNYVNTKIAQISAKSRDYNSLKKKKEELLDTAQDIEKLKEYQFRLALSFEKLSQAIVDGVEITSLDFDETNHDFAGYAKLSGEATSLESISDFVNQLENVLPDYKVTLGKLGQSTGQNRSFNITIDFIEEGRAR